MKATWKNVDRITILKIDGTSVYLLDNEKLEEAYRFFYDRWTWDTGSDEDLKVLRALEGEVKRRMDMGPMDIEEELVVAMSAQITKEIDKEILADLMQMQRNKCSGSVMVARQPYRLRGPD